MEASKHRTLADGREFDHLFPKPEHTDNSVKTDASVRDTVKLIKEKVPETKWHTAKIAPLLKGRDLNETCSNIWHFVYQHIQYKPDKTGFEQVRSPRRTWFERVKGVDCDCYSEFISTVLCNLGIPHKLRIAMYTPERGWQHIYPIVPINGRLDTPMEDHSQYIVIDCVKDDYNAEQPYLEYKDYNMELQFLDGVDGDEDDDGTMNENYDLPELSGSIDMQDMAGSDREELGNLFKNIGKSFNKVVKQVKHSVDVNAANLKHSAEVNAANAKKAVKEGVKKVGTAVKEGVHVLNRFVNPSSVVLRNGFLLAMKENLMNASGRIKYAYLTDEQAVKMGIDLGRLKNLRSVRDKVENIYYTMGGEKSVLKKAILEGRGNKGHAVPLSGLEGLGEVYADMQEYQIMNPSVHGVGELGEPISIAAALATITALVAAIKSCGNLFKGGTKQASDFNSENPDPDDPSSAADNAALTNGSSDATADIDLTKLGQGLTLPGSATAPLNMPNFNQMMPGIPGLSNKPVMTSSPVMTSGGGNGASDNSDTSQDSTYSDTPGGATDTVTTQARPDSGSNLPSLYVPQSPAPVSSAIQKANAILPANTNPPKETFTQWISDHKTVVVVTGIGVAAVAGFLIYEHEHANAAKATKALSGLPTSKRDKKKEKKAKAKEKFYCEKFRK
jgi:hypothetical protein